MKVVNKIILGDCLQEMKGIESESIDLVLTDPPYNAKSIGPKHRKYSVGQMQLPTKQYQKFCKAWFNEATRIAKAVVFTPGIANVCFYPQPSWIICWHKPAAVSFNRFGGFNAWEPIFIYGKAAKRIGQDYIKVNTLNFSKGPEKDHPCPKPLPLWTWLVEHFSKQDEIILDPFMGSGTTAVAAKQLHRKFIGIEINPAYIAQTNLRLKNEPLPLAA